MRTILTGWRARRAQPLALAASLLLTAAPTGVLDPGDLPDLLDEADQLEDDAAAAEAELGELDEELARQRDELVALTERLRAAEAELSAVEQQLELVEAELDAAEARHERAELQHRAAREALTAISAELAEGEQAFEEQVRAAYTGGSIDELELLQIAVSEDTVGEILHSWEQLGRAGATQRVHVDELAALRRQQEMAESRAKETERQRDAERAAAEHARDSVAELRDEQQRRRDEVASLRGAQAEVVARLDADRERQQRLLRETRAELAAVRERADEAAQAASGGGVVCPVPGASFIDDWGFPRSGGRQHKGNDLFADRGAPILAPADGVVRKRTTTDRWRPGSQSGLGGKTLSVATAPGTWWYFAHLDEIADGVEPGTRVRAGQQIGTVGNTGNARHTPPHLHLGYYPDGTPQNPYPLIRPACG